MANLPCRLTVQEHESITSYRGLWKSRGVLAIGFEGAFHPEEFALEEIAGAVGVGLALFLTATAAALWRAVRCVLRNRLAVLLVTLGALTFSRRLAPFHILAVACIGFACIAIEQITVRRRLTSS